MRVEVREYDPTWPVAFAGIADELSAALAGVEIVAIEHVGSTSVPCLAAKPIIDVDVIVRNERLAGEASRALAAVGYLPMGDLGVPQRYAFTAPDRRPRRNVYVTIDGCLSVRNHLGVRDVLRRNPELRERYGRLKLSLAENEYDDIGEYVSDKSVVLQQILREAGLGDDERSVIATVNDNVNDNES